jgi:hypothetical protein
LVLIGDVHGCLDELEALWRACAIVPGERVIFVGDLVAKGPDSQGVVALARERGAQSVLGNHDQAVLRYMRARERGGELPKLKTAHRQVVDTLEPADWAYLGTLPLYIELPDVGLVVVHAGVVPGVPLAAQREEDLLTMRTVTPAGSASSRLDEGELWGLHYRGPAQVVFGHDAVTGLQLHPFATGIDTGCVYGRELTALTWPERRLIRVPARRAYKEWK